MFETTLRSLPTSNWLSLMLIFSFFLFVGFKLIYKERLFQNYIVFFSNKYFLNFGKDSKSIFNSYFLISYFFQCLFLTLFAFTYFKFNPNDLFSENLLTFGILAGIINVYFIGKLLIGLLFKIVFDISTIYESVTFQKVSYLTSIAFLLFPLLIISNYSQFYPEKIFKISLILFIILLLYRYLMLVLNNKLLIVSYLFYFILYLCTVEIAPFIIFYKLKF
ncbi:DUF4271 domain-containing protein [Aureivirga sp. CE67]|uniref:DUF4271 domain-containing protein n=1 Tax=Aureivirga sp. CE67 TaxID=1788983 RepID=UPI00397A54E9